MTDFIGLIITAIIIVAVIAVGVFALTVGHNLFNVTKAPPQNHNNVLVTGSVKTTGTFTKPVEIAFNSSIDQGNATVNPNGYYSIYLLGGETYNVTVYFNGALGRSSSAKCSNMSVYVADNITSGGYNVTC